MIHVNVQPLNPLRAEILNPLTAGVAYIRVSFLLAH